MGDDWAELSHGRTIGKRIKIPLPAADSGSIAMGNQNMFQLQAENDAALQLCITMIPPAVIPALQFPGGIVPIDSSVSENATGERTNEDIYIHPNPGNYSWMQAVAFVEWGIGGVQAKVECDFLNGLVLNICASWIRISAFIDAVLPDGVVISGGIIVLGAFIGPGYPKANNAQRTFNVGQVFPIAAGVPDFPQKGFQGTLVNPSGAFTNLFPVPFFAKHASIIFAAPLGAFGPIQQNNANCSLNFYRDKEGLFLIGGYHLTNDNPGPVPIPNGACYWTVQNNGLIQNDCSVIFELAV